MEDDVGWRMEGRMGAISSGIFRRQQNDEMFRKPID